MRCNLRKFLFTGVLPVFPALCLCFCCTQQPTVKPSAAPAQAALPYDLENPSLTINLVSDDLKEISGIGPTEQKGVYVAIADEKGVIYFVDGAGGGAVRDTVLFRDKGDFEGVEMVGETLWAMKSDGKLFAVERWKNGKPQVTEYDTPLKKSDDVEGLGYDHERKALLLACKGDPDSSYLRKVYAFDVKTRQFNPQPVISLDPKRVNELVPYLDSEKHDYFSPSGIAVHPKTGEIYLISAALKRLVVLDKNTGNIHMAARLNKKLLPQPEGISFDPEGNLIISSEGKKGEGLILQFRYHPKQ